jgi:hypothetical protein
VRRPLGPYSVSARDRLLVGLVAITTRSRRIRAAQGRGVRPLTQRQQRFVRRHMDAVRRRVEQPLMRAGDSIGRAAPKHAGPVDNVVDRRRHAEPEGRPVERGAGLEIPFCVRRGDVAMPGRPVVDIGMKPPYDLERSSDVDFRGVRSGRIAGSSPVSVAPDRRLSAAASQLRLPRRATLCVRKGLSIGVPHRTRISS